MTEEVPTGNIIQDEELDRRIAEESKFKINTGGDILLQSHKFSQSFFTSCHSLVSVSKDGFILGMQQTRGNWAVTSPKGKLIKKSTLPNQINTLFDLIYIQKHRSFFIFEQSRKEIWKINLNNLEPELWMTGLKGMIIWIGKPIRGVFNGGAIAFKPRSSEVTLIEIQDDGSKGRVVTSSLSSSEFVAHIEVGGEHGDIIIALSMRMKQLISCKINNDLKVEVLRVFSLSSCMNERDEVATLAISPCAKYVFVHTFLYRSKKATKQLMISVNGEEMKLCATFDLSSQNIDSFNFSLAYLKSIGDELVFKAVSFTYFPPLIVLTMIYNKRTGEFRELVHHRKILVGNKYFIKLVKQGDTLYSVGYDISSLLKIT